MRRLFPVTDQTVPTHSAGSPLGAPGEGGDAAQDREWSLDELADAYAYPEPVPDSSPEGLPDSSPESVPGSSPESGRGRRPWLRANMVSTLDGAAQHEGRSQPISTAADMRIFGTLRGLADVVVVGAETVRLEGYRPARARAEFARRREAAGQGPAPAVAVVTAGLDLDFSLPLFTSPLVPTLILTGAAAAPDRIAAAERAGARVVIAGDGMGVEPGRAVRALADLGHTRLLTEGGPRLLGQFVAAGVLDELCLTLSPMLTVGDAQRIAGGPSLAVPQRFALASLLEEEGFLFGRYRRP
ncbi:pyrimidine reductase family protein [Streptomyces sp. IBSBF 2953]|uniref:pyrimidine reductase family protein n=1 Tax=Streptomyces scabiei TaxID=1930 RepID=UPI00211A8E14|nr:pyrimidine reductase family protein [Streptomyces scabiei]MCQ9184894.1 pyrimidine reductase family protein [Streptomyces hayashii]MDX3118552.1 pyrimidine reductase family protein [Streptomyces scabiei]